MRSKRFHHYTFLDLETGGLDDDSEILEIAIVRETRKTGELFLWSSFVKPLHPEKIQIKALEINGITPEDWERAPTLEELSTKILGLLQWGPVIGHNLQRLKHNFSKMGKVFPRPFPVLCTQQMAWLWYDEMKSCSLNSCREYLGIGKLGAHRAEKDVMDCRRVFWDIMGLMEK